MNGLRNLFSSTTDAWFLGFEGSKVVLHISQKIPWSRAQGKLEYCLALALLCTFIQQKYIPLSILIELTGQVQESFTFREICWKAEIGIGSKVNWAGGQRGTWAILKLRNWNWNARKAWMISKFWESVQYSPSVYFCSNFRILLESIGWRGSKMTLKCWSLEK